MTTIKQVCAARDHRFYDHIHRAAIVPRDKPPSSLDIHAPPAHFSPVTMAHRTKQTPGEILYTDRFPMRYTRSKQFAFTEKKVADSRTKIAAAKPREAKPRLRTQICFNEMMPTSVIAHVGNGRKSADA